MKTPRSLLLLLLTGLCINGYKPVIIVHGLFDGPKEFTTLVSFINKVGQLKSISLSHESVLCQNGSSWTDFVIKVLLSRNALSTINFHLSSD